MGYTSEDMVGPLVKDIIKTRTTIAMLEQQLGWEQQKFELAIREVNQSFDYVQTPQASRPRSPAWNTVERNEVFQESKQAVEPTLPRSELPEPPVLPLADQPGIFSRPADTPLLPSQDARNIPRQSNPPPPPANESDPTRNLDQTSFQNGQNLGNRRRSPRPTNSNRPLDDDEDLSPPRGSPSKEKEPYYVTMMRSPRYGPGVLRPPVPDYRD
jgi:hypothetical protein